MKLIGLTDPTRPNLDLGRHLTFADIPADGVYPLDERDDGGVHCYLCQQARNWNLTGLSVLTRSSGVFTDLVRCDQDAPVYVCLEHIPFRGDQFEVFTSEVAQALRLASEVRSHVS